MLRRLCRYARLLMVSLLPGVAMDCGMTATKEERSLECEGTVSATPWEPISDKTFRRGPYLQSVMGEEAVIVWRDAPGGPKGCVTWSLPGEAPQTSCASADRAGQYEVRLEDLPRDTLVSYRASVAARTTVALSFRTAPADSRPVRLAVFADAHANEVMLDGIAGQALADGVDAVVSVGDNVSEPEESQLDELFAGLRELLHRVPLWPGIGNHEALGQPYFDAIVVPGAGDDPPELYYGVRFGAVWIGALDLSDFQLSAANDKDLPEVTWLRSALSSAEAVTARWRLLFIHQPPYSAGWGQCDGYHGEESLRELLVPLAAEHDVAAIFSGHMHGYEHGEVQGVHLFVTGGAGGDLDIACETPEGFPSPWVAEYAYHHLVVDAGCEQLTVEARKTDGTVIETTTIPAPVPPAASGEVSRSSPVAHGGS